MSKVYIQETDKYLAESLDFEGDYLALRDLGKKYASKSEVETVTWKDDLFEVVGHCECCDRFIFLGDMYLVDEGEFIWCRPCLHARLRDCE